MLNLSLLLWKSETPFSFPLNQVHPLGSVPLMAQSPILFQRNFLFYSGTQKGTGWAGRPTGILHHQQTFCDKLLYFSFYMIISQVT